MSKEGAPMQPLLPSSHSSESLFKSCPRKYELYKLANLERLTARTNTIHTVCGSAVGAGLASLLESPEELSLAYHKAFCAWGTDVPLNEALAGKSLPAAFEAIKQFSWKAKALHANGWQIAEINGKLTTEVSFKLNIKGYGYYVGFIDAIMIHPETGKLMVIEAKTMNREFHPAEYQNSKQDVGYLLASRLIGNFEAEVFYPVATMLKDKVSWSYNIYERTQQDFDEFLITLGYSYKLKRMMQEQELFPRDGTACRNWGQLCPMFGDCHKHFEYDASSQRPTSDTDYDIVIDIEL